MIRESTYARTNHPAVIGPGVIRRYHHIHCTMTYLIAWLIIGLIASLAFGLIAQE